MDSREAELGGKASVPPSGGEERHGGRAVTIRRIAIAYFAISVAVVVVGAVMKELPWRVSDTRYSLSWFVLGPLVAPFYAVRASGGIGGLLAWSIYYLIGSVLMLPSLALVVRGQRRIARIAGYFAAVASWLAVGFLILMAVWGA
jgi:hypothetical protein